ncbi:Radical SAM superfamily enzyme YgiQ, UPF0313 family [Sporobacter termitidis DSM 10068]|uniref:Radical SAM superfamily enzyme YgiQ, UPF0313 family n=1 Tax=Sporobacter termitidis DSM 10068 TaxID=1123282 RepID=A0A1M5UMV1_9FIRM|nr:radical SAM protein [Sporobacter termitidis]SHH64335.1 Radical SAM superfamily enzyme YgiQ, UPF0313 family [Sporobacter termitidis DSM 10068]
MKIVLIAPVRDEGRKTRDIIRFPMVSLLYIAALTPEKHDVTIVEEEAESVDYSMECDLVAITSMTATAKRSYKISEEFMRRGKTVVLGGIHPTVLPAEAKLHCSAVITGEAEPVWRQVLDDIENGSLQAFYHGGAMANLDDYPLPRRDLVQYTSPLKLEPIVTSRGCPYSCEFCSVWKFFGKRIRHVGVDRVLQDIANTNSKRFMFLDDNIVGDPVYAKALFTALKELNIEWVGQASISFSKNEELLRLAYESGCRGLFFGLESVSEQKMKRMSKSMRTQADTIDAIKRIMAGGILFHASLVFGFDDDDESVFDETLEFLHKTKIPSATFNILTPYPGTDIFEKFKSQNRLITEDWDFYDHCTVTYLPQHMTIDRLYEGYQYVMDNYYSLGSILQRFPASAKRPLLFTMINAGMKNSLKAGKADSRDRLTRLHNIIEDNYRQNASSPARGV